MKIRDITLTAIRYPAPYPPVRHGRNERIDMTGTILQVFTDEGLVGLSDATAPIGQVRPILERQVKPLLIGENPLDVERVWEKIARGVTGRPHSDLVGSIDTALWDLVGKAANLPLFRIFGAYRNRVPCYVAPSMRQPEVLFEELAAYRDRGFKATKLRLGLGPVGWADGPRDLSRDRATLRGARDLLGPDFAIGADTDKTYDHALAAQMVPLVNELDLAWFEEPLPNLPREAYVREMLRLREIVRVPLAGGQGLFTPPAFDGLINTGAVDAIQPDVNQCGGLTPLRKIAHMAAGRGITCIPHVSCQNGSDLLVMATAQALGAMPNGRWLCYQPYDTPLRTELLTEQLKVVDGELQLPERPGLGLELNQQALKRYAVDS
jgi:L-alanine-DL-glutamate epimerase-like enolase superfamily enzyme